MSANVESASIAPSRTRIHRALTVAVAAAGAAVFWVLVDPVAGVDLAVRGGGSVGLGAVIATSLIAGLAAWALLALLERLVARPRQAWTANALVALALSLFGPLASGVDLSSRLLLACLHLIVGLVLMVGLWRTIRH